MTDWTVDQVRGAFARIASMPLPTEPEFAYMRFMFDLRIALDYAEAHPIRCDQQDDPVESVRAAVFNTRLREARNMRNKLTIGNAVTNSSVQSARVAFAQLREVFLEIDS